MREYGTNVVADVRGKGGQTVLGVRVFNTAQEAVKALGGIDISVLLCPRRRERSGDFCDCADIHLSGALLRAPELFPKMNEQG
jgi:hypothetical protein